VVLAVDKASRDQVAAINRRTEITLNEKGRAAHQLPDDLDELAVQVFARFRPAAQA
jgi:hypothetical protein